MNINPGTGLPATVFSPVLVRCAGFLFSMMRPYILWYIFPLPHGSFDIRALYRSTSSLWKILQWVAMKRSTSDSL